MCIHALFCSETLTSETMNSSRAGSHLVGVSGVCVEIEVNVCRCDEKGWANRTSLGSGGVKECLYCFCLSVPAAVLMYV